MSFTHIATRSMPPDPSQNLPAMRRPDDRAYEGNHAVPLIDVHAGGRVGDRFLHDCSPRNGRRMHSHVTVSPVSMSMIFPPAFCTIHRFPKTFAAESDWRRKSGS